MQFHVSDFRIRHVQMPFFFLWVQDLLKVAFAKAISKNSQQTRNHISRHPAGRKTPACQFVTEDTPDKTALWKITFRGAPVFQAWTDPWLRPTPQKGP